MTPRPDEDGDMRAKFKELGRDSLIYGVSGMVQKFIAVLLVPLYWPVFLPDELGQQALVLTVVTLLTAFAALGMDSAAHTWFWQTEDANDRRCTIATWFWCQMAVSLVLGSLLALLAEPVSVLISGDTGAATLLRLAAATLPLTVAGAVLTNYFRLQRRPAATLWFTAASSMLLVALNLLFILVLHWGMPGFFLAQIAAGIAGTAAAVWLLRGTLHPRHAARPRLRGMLRFALPLMPAALALWVMGLSDRLFIEKMLNTHEVGLYAAAATLATAVAMITGAFTTAWGPFALSMQRQPDAPALYARGLLLYLALGGSMVVAVALFTPDVMTLLARPQYLGAAPVVGILSLSLLTNGLTTIASTGLALAKQSAPVSGGAFRAAIVSVVLNLLLLPLLGKTGSAWASLTAWAVCAAYVFYRAQQIHRLPYNLPRVLLIAVLLVASVLLAPQLHTGVLLRDLLLKCLASLAIAGVILTIALPGWPGMLRRSLRAA